MANRNERRVSHPSLLPDANSACGEDSLMIFHVRHRTITDGRLNIVCQIRPATSQLWSPSGHDCSFAQFPLHTVELLIIVFFFLEQAFSFLRTSNERRKKFKAMAVFTLVFLFLLLLGNFPRSSRNLEFDE